MLFVTYLMWESMYDEAVIGSGLEGRYGDSYMVCQDRSRDHMTMNYLMNLLSRIQGNIR